jgi:regulator of sigma E protease
LSLLVFIHELGHFIVAKLAGIRVEGFSLGFGPELFGYTYGDTRYAIRVFPVGGYVKPAGEFEEEEKTPEPKAGEVPVAVVETPAPRVRKPDEFLAKPWYIRALLLVAGPAMNFVLAVAILFGVYATIGYPDTPGPAQVRALVEGKPAEKAGIKLQDVILKINGAPVTFKQLPEVVNASSRQAPGKPLKITVRRGLLEKTILVTPVLDEAAQAYRIGVMFEAGPESLARQVERVLVNTPAEKAGFKAGDEIFKVEGRVLPSGGDFARVFGAAKGEIVSVELKRGAKVLTLKVPKKQPIPESWKDKADWGLLGLELRPEGTTTFEKIGVIKAAKVSLITNAAMAVAMLVVVRDLVTLKLRFRESIGGPISIVRMAKQQAEIGWLKFLEFICQLSVMLCVMNLLPIPILDGGTLVLCLVEGVRGKAVSFKVQQALQMVGLGLIALLMIASTSNDLANLFGNMLKKP